MLSRAYVRAFSNGRFALPTFKGEPFLHYAPGSSERAALAAACKTTRATCVEIPCVVNGKEYFTGDTQLQSMPSDHQVKVAKFHRATPQLIQEAIKVSQTARAEWANLCEPLPSISHPTPSLSLSLSLPRLIHGSPASSSAVPLSTGPWYSARPAI